MTSTAGGQISLHRKYWRTSLLIALLLLTARLLAGGSSGSLPEVRMRLLDATTGKPLAGIQAALAMIGEHGTPIGTLRKSKTDSDGVAVFELSYNIPHGIKLIFAPYDVVTCSEMDYSTGAVLGIGIVGKIDVSCGDGSAKDSVSAKPGELAIFAKLTGSDPATVKGHLAVTNTDGHLMPPEQATIYLIYFEDPPATGNETAGAAYAAEQARVVRRIAEQTTKNKAQIALEPQSQRTYEYETYLLETVDAALKGAEGWAETHPEKWQFISTQTTDGLWSQSGLRPGKYRIVARAVMGNLDAEWESKVTVGAGETVSLALTHISMGRKLPDTVPTQAPSTQTPSHSTTASLQASNVPQFDEGRKTGFVRGMSGELVTKDKIKLGFTDYMAPDGAYLKVLYNDFSDAGLAAEVFNKQLAGADVIVKKEAKLDEKGIAVGERALMVYPPIDAGKPTCAVLWTDGLTFHEIQSTNLEDILQFEKVYKY